MDFILRFNFNFDSFQKIKKNLCFFLLYYNFKFWQCNSFSNESISFLRELFTYSLKRKLLWISYWSSRIVARHYIQDYSTTSLKIPPNFYLLASVPSSISDAFPGKAVQEFQPRRRRQAPFSLPLNDNNFQRFRVNILYIYIIWNNFIPGI